MGFYTLLPVLVAVGLSLWTKRAVFSLFCGVFLGALLLQNGNPITATWYLVNHLLLDSLTDADSMKVILFSLLIAGSVELMRVGQGTQALVNQVVRFATTRKRALLGTWFAGLLVFFDDYANCLIVGSSMRPITDKLKISRAKLAYLVDSTAAPVATLALISTWVGYEVSVIDEVFQSLSPMQIQQAGLENVDAYAFFLQGLPYRFYPILALVFGFVIAVTARDFGPMLVCEQKAQEIEDELPQEISKNRIWLGVLPIFLLICVSLLSLYLQGTQKNPAATSISEIIAAADGYDAMLQGSLASIISAFFLNLLYQTTQTEMTSAIKEGFLRIAEAIMVLLLAWSIGSVMKELGSAEYFIELLNGKIAVQWLPSLVFILAAGIAFATGTSFGTMGTLMPLALPLVIQSDASYEIILAVCSAVLSGATWGDHCSPISDTTVLSSTGAGCDHVEHVQTQMPYALISGLISLLCCSLPVGYGFSWEWCLLLGTLLCFGVIFLWGQKMNESAKPVAQK